MIPLLCISLLLLSDPEVLPVPKQKPVSIELGKDFTLAPGQTGEILSTGSAAQNGRPATPPAKLVLEKIDDRVEDPAYHFKLSGPRHQPILVTLSKKSCTAVIYEFHLRLVQGGPSSAHLLLTLTQIP
jgi:hypothetical protein